VIAQIEFVIDPWWFECLSLRFEYFEAYKRLYLQIQLFTWVVKIGKTCQVGNPRVECENYVHKQVHKQVHKKTYIR